MTNLTIAFVTAIIGAVAAFHIWATWDAERHKADLDAKTQLAASAFYCTKGHCP